MGFGFGLDLGPGSRVRVRGRGRVRFRVRVRVGAAGHYLRASIGPSEAVDQLVAAEARFAWHRK